MVIETRILERSATDRATMMERASRITSTMAASLAAIVACSQWNFTVDPTFQMQISQQAVNSLLLNEDGTVIGSGVMRLQGELTDRYLMRLQNSGAHDVGFLNTGAGGGKLTRWQDRMYVGHAQTLRRVLMNGSVDASFGSPNLLPCRYFNSLQGGDYHVYPDGSVLISGNHQLHDSIRGFVGRHQLMWLTNTGCLDTTRTHRTGGQCAVYRFKELSNGQFICSTTCSQFDGQEIDKIFRVNSDGSVDTTFRTGVYIGDAQDYLSLNDGRVYTGGNFRRTEAPTDTLRLVRFLPNGDLDPGFTIPSFTAGEGLSTPFGAYVHGITAWHDGTLLITGHFKRVNGEERRGICLIDSTGQLLPAFSEQGVGPFTFSSLTGAAVLTLTFNEDSTQVYICGVYNGYDDGITNYPQQRFITRLKVEEVPVTVEETAHWPVSVLSIHPNPASGTVTIHIGAERSGTIVVRDALGRVVDRSIPCSSSVSLDSRSYASGIYFVDHVVDGVIQGSAKLVVE